LHVLTAIKPCDVASGCKLGVLLSVSALTLALLPASSGSTPVVPVAAVALATPAPQAASVRHTGRTAAFGAATPTPDLRAVADWIADTQDNGRAEFVVVDKRAAQLHVFDADAHWLASSPVLLGAALGDDSVPGIGTRPMAAIQEHERTTPAGRFVGERGVNASGVDVVWVDYDAAVSMHRVRLNNPSEHRAERLASPTIADNRISYGCINVPEAFYERYIQPVFAHQRALVYVLPDVKSVQQVFGPDTAAPRTAGGLSPSVAQQATP
jgi:hypothetical protein